MPLISKGSEYGLRAALYVAGRSGEGFVPIREIAQDLDISFTFLSKILHRLVAAGLLKSYRGPRGGVELARPGQEISLLDVLEAIEEHPPFSGCVLGLGGCGEARPCPLHDQWAVERERLQALFARATLEKTALAIARHALRLTDT